MIPFGIGTSGRIFFFVSDELFFVLLQLANLLSVFPALEVCSEQFWISLNGTLQFAKKAESLFLTIEDFVECCELGLRFSINAITDK